MNVIQMIQSLFVKNQNPVQEEKIQWTEVPVQEEIKWTEVPVQEELEWIDEWIAESGQDCSDDLYDYYVETGWVD